MRRLCFLSLGFCLFLAAFLPVKAETGPTPMRAILVLDASGSMWGQIDGRAKIEIARDVITKLVDELPEETELGLMAYGHRTKGDCEDIELLIAPGKLDRAAFKAKVADLVPKGMTPLTDAVVLAAEALRSTEAKATVILVTDGEETCDRDPCEVAKKLEETGVDFTAHVVAFDLSAKAAKSVECMSRETGGLFLPAGDAGSLLDALQMTVEAEGEKKEESEKPAEAVGEATVAGPEAVIAGTAFEATWTGPDDRGDFITIVPKDAEDEDYRNYAYTRSGSPLKITAILDEGMAELRYLHGKTRKVLARADLTVVPAEVALKGPESAVAGAEVTVEWVGPDNSGDYITIVSKETEDGKFAKYAYTRDGNPLKVLAPVEMGDCEIRYMAGQGSKVLARVPLKVTAAEVTLKAIEEVVAGSNVTIEWTGPNNEGDFISIVSKEMEDGKYAKYAYTSAGNPSKVLAPVEVGDCEIRYMTGQGYKVLARIPLKVTAAEVTLKALAEAEAGSLVAIEWTGPNNEGDYLTIVAKDVEDGKYARYAYTEAGSPSKVEAPKEAGDCEIRYMTGQGGKVIKRIPIKIIPATTNEE